MLLSKLFTVIMPLLLRTPRFRLHTCTQISACTQLSLALPLFGSQQKMASKIAGDQMKDFTLKGVVPLGKELGRGAYGKVFTVKYLGLVCAAKEIHSLLLDGVDQVQKKAIKDSFVRECTYCNVIRHPNIVQFLGVYFSSEQSDLPIMVMELMDTSIASFVENNQSKIALNTKVIHRHYILRTH